MAFVNPFLLAGTALVAIPIVLHLVMRPRARQVEFPALRLVQKRREVSQRRLQLRHLILLALRGLAILLLAVALARPSVKLSGGWGSQEAPVAAALVFDTATRMEYIHQNRSRLDAAREMGLWLLAQLPPESQVAVLDTSPAPAAFQVDRGAARHRIERLATSASSQSLSAALDRAAELLEQSELVRREVYVFSDMARAAWPSESAARLRDRLARMADASVYVIDVGVEEPMNSALGDLKLSGQVLSSQSRLRIETGVSRRGPAAEQTVELYVLEPDPEKPQGPPVPRKSGQKLLRVEPGQGQAVEFEIGWLTPGVHQGYVEIAGDDALACDNRRYFTVEVRPAWPILLSAPKPAARFTFFLKQMLAPESLARNGQAQFRCDVIDLDELAGHDLEPYAAVCLVDPAPLEPEIWRKLGEYVSAGRGLAVFLGRKAGAAESFNREEAQALLPGKLLRQARRPDGDLHLAPADFQHPILAAFRDRAESVPWQGMPVLRYWQLDGPGPGVDVVVAYNDGQPAILERPVGKGRVLTMTTPVSDDPNQNPWNYLPVGQPSWPLFILANQMALYLAGSSDAQLNYYAGQMAVVRLDPERLFRSYTLITPEAGEGAEVRLTPDVRENTLTVTSTDRLGNYRVVGGGPGGIEQGFSVNLPPEATRLDRIAESDLAGVLGDVPCHVARDRTQVEIDRNQQRVGRELFAVLILVLAAALGVEHVLANRFYRE